ncbi:MAG TPA: N-acetyl-gamma-glutamyl-phosphate reductase [Flavobacteriaceae bacterium]|nr:N-acetyl-gamma-glutamyl-phosphate reductase [Flavobacteriaceae bacterium]
MIEVGIIGGAGYTAGELIRILLHHDKVHLNFVCSTSNAGNPLAHVHQDLIGDTRRCFSNEISTDVDVVFLCLGHGQSKDFLKENTFSEHTKIIDLSNDFRLATEGNSFVYGLPELNKEKINSAQSLANPGCFATAIELALLPLAATNKLMGDVHINAVTGATGAGTALSETTDFTWREANFSHYKAFEHQHLAEVNATLNSLQKNFKNELLFIPNRGGFSRGIFATMYTSFYGSEEEAVDLYSTYYETHPFTVVSEKAIHLKQVVNTNKCLLHLKKYKDKLLITSAIDNLLKGASGQAVQNMNLLFGLEETTGLQLKASYF